MNFDRIRRIHLIGICGTAMASLAGLLKEKGYEVSGSDSNVYPPMSCQLQELRIDVSIGYRPENLRKTAPDLVIPGNAVPRGNPELEEMLNLRLPYLSMAEALRELFLRDKRSIVIAGTHGKTTTSSLVSWVLESGGMSPSFLIGGIPLNFGRSYNWNKDSNVFVIEGDEYDTGFMDRRPKFVQYLPDMVVLNPVEFDHADLYPDLKAVENAFWQLIKVVPSNSPVIVSRDSEVAYGLAKRGYSNVISFGYHPASDYRISSVQWQGDTAQYQLNEETYQIQVFGKHNIANASAAAIVGKHLGMSFNQIQTALQTFQGVKRRMEIRGEIDGIAVYDDFAHHPTAIASTLEGARLAFPLGKIWAIFEPRSWSSRRNVFQVEFGKAFRDADYALIAGIFEPEKVPIEIRLDPQRMISDIQKEGTAAFYVPEQSNMLDVIVNQTRPGDKVILMSNGSFDGLHDKILDALRNRRV